MTQSNDMPDEFKLKTRLMSILITHPQCEYLSGMIVDYLKSQGIFPPPQSPNRAVLDALDKLEDANYGVPTTSEDSLHRDLAIANAVYEIRTILDRISAPVGVPDGFKLVQIEPTEEMFDAGFEQYKKDKLNYDKVYVGDIYEAMLSAAPTPAPIDLDALKREVGEYVSRHYPKSRPAVNFAIGILSATGRLKV